MTITHRNKLSQLFITIPHSSASELHPDANLTKETLGLFIKDNFNTEGIVVVEEPHTNNIGMHLHALVLLTSDGKVNHINAKNKLQHEYPEYSARIDIDSCKAAYSCYLYCTQPGYQCTDTTKPVKSYDEVDSDPLIIGRAPKPPGGFRRVDQREWTRLCHSVYRNSGIILQHDFDIAKENHFENVFLNLGL